MGSILNLKFWGLAVLPTDKFDRIRSSQKFIDTQVNQHFSVFSVFKNTHIFVICLYIIISLSWSAIFNNLGGLLEST